MIIKILVINCARNFLPSLLPSSAVHKALDINGTTTGGPVKIADLQLVFPIDNFQTPTFLLMDLVPPNDEACLSGEGILDSVLHLRPKTVLARILLLIHFSYNMLMGNPLL